LVEIRWWRATFAYPEGVGPRAPETPGRYILLLKNEYQEGGSYEYRAT